MSANITDTFPLNMLSFMSQTVQSQVIEPPDPTEPRQCVLLILVGGSGVGKSTLLKSLFTQYPDKYAFLTDTTTRHRRDGENSDSVSPACREKRFVTREDFARMIYNHKFVNWFRNEINGEYYGLEWSVLLDALVTGRILVTTVDGSNIRSAIVNPWRRIMENGTCASGFALKCLLSSCGLTKDILKPVVVLVRAGSNTELNKRLLATGSSRGAEFMKLELESRMSANERGDVICEQLLSESWNPSSPVNDGIFSKAIVNDTSRGIESATSSLLSYVDHLTTPVCQTWKLTRYFGFYFTVTRGLLKQAHQLSIWACKGAAYCDRPRLIRNVDTRNTSSQPLCSRHFLKRALMNRRSAKFEIVPIAGDRPNLLVWMSLACLPHLLCIAPHLLRDAYNHFVFGGMWDLANFPSYNLLWGSFGIPQSFAAFSQSVQQTLRFEATPSYGGKLGEILENNIGLGSVVSLTSAMILGKLGQLARRLSEKFQFLQKKTEDAKENKDPSEPSEKSSALSSSKSDRTLSQIRSLLHFRLSDTSMLHFCLRWLGPVPVILALGINAKKSSPPNSSSANKQQSFIGVLCCALSTFQDSLSGMLNNCNCNTSLKSALVSCLTPFIEMSHQIETYDYRLVSELLCIQGVTLGIHSVSKGFIEFLFQEEANVSQGMDASSLSKLNSMRKSVPSRVDSEATSLASWENVTNDGGDDDVLLDNSCLSRLQLAKVRLDRWTQGFSVVRKLRSLNLDPSGHVRVAVNTVVLLGWGATSTDGRGNAAFLSSSWMLLQCFSVFQSAMWHHRFSDLLLGVVMAVPHIILLKAVERK